MKRLRKYFKTPWGKSIDNCRDKLVHITRMLDFCVLDLQEASGSMFNYNKHKFIKGSGDIEFYRGIDSKLADIKRIRKEIKELRISLVLYARKPRV